VKLPPLLRSRSQEAQVLLIVAVPAVYGFLTGVALGGSKGIYIVMNLFAAIGGYLAGFDHDEVGEVAVRGAAGGTLFGTFILLAHEITGASEEAKLPDPTVVLVVFTAIGGVLLGALGTVTRRRLERRQAA